jgi:hypothetical protein
MLLEDGDVSLYVSYKEGEPATLNKIWRQQLVSMSVVEE